MLKAWLLSALWKAVFDDLPAIRKVSVFLCSFYRIESRDGRPSGLYIRTACFTRSKAGRLPFDTARVKVTTAYARPSPWAILGVGGWQRFRLATPTTTAHNAIANRGVTGAPFSNRS